MADLSIFKLNSETITIKDTTARQAAESAKTLATTASDNATTALNKINELESEKADTIISSTSGAIASLPDGAESTAKKLVVGIEPVQEGMGDPSPDNVRPISGWTGAKVTRTGKNLLDDAYADTSSANFLWLYRNVGFPLKANQTYTFSVNRIAKSIRIVSVDESVVYAQLPSANKSMSYTPTSDILVVFRVWFNDGGILSGLKPQLELGSTATTYEPYQGETYPITFPSEAGTVYGGTLDATNGVLTVDRAQIASYAGETLPSTWISDRDVYSAGATPTTGAQVVYELATPQTYQLTPTEIRTLLGQNNIWADTGDMSVTYRADTKLYIDNKFTELQALILENLEGETDHDSTKENMTITTGTHSVE